MPQCIQYFYCIKHASAKRAKLTDVEFIFLHKTASSVAKNIHSGFHQFIEMSLFLLIIFEAVTQIFPVIPLKLHVHIRIISINYDVQFKCNPDSENRNKIPWVVFEKLLLMLAV